MTPAKVHQVLRALHQTPRAVGTEDLAGLPGMPGRRTLYRWQRSLDQQLIYYPNVALSAFGLVHLHVFLDDPSSAWCEWPYTVRSRWVVRGPGARTLYLHCVVPLEHVETITDAITTDPASYMGVTIVTTGDGHQVFDGEGCASTPATSAVDLLERYPLLVPVIFESMETRRSAPEVWRAIYDRLGDAVWQYLPRFARRLPHNGKRYVAEAFGLLNAAHLVSQHVIRYGPWQESTIGVTLVLEGSPDDATRLFEDSVIEVFPATTGETLVHINATLRCLRRIFSAEFPLPISACFVSDDAANAHTPVRARFAHEQLFDPRTTSWILPERFSQ